nr:hypothetical protein [Tanacetum cinerariifolium]
NLDVVVGRGHVEGGVGQELTGFQLQGARYRYVVRHAVHGQVAFYLHRVRAGPAQRRRIGPRKVAGEGGFGVLLRFEVILVEMLLHERALELKLADGHRKRQLPGGQVEHRRYLVISGFNILDGTARKEVDMTRFDLRSGCEGVTRRKMRLFADGRRPRGASVVELAGSYPGLDASDVAVRHFRSAFGHGVVAGLLLDAAQEQGGGHGFECLIGA